MVDLRPREALGHDSTVYVLSQLSAAATDELFNCKLLHPYPALQTGC